MRLINCQTLQLEEFSGGKIPAYAILSHTWSSQEVSFSDYTSNRAAAESKDEYKKIRFACEQACKDKIPYVWVDTCCIDKSSSAELTESINSMYKWYQDSDVCYAYLTDVSEANFEIEFPESRWFSRGWTLQELLAPSRVYFYDQHWCGIGSKHEHAGLISEITRIDMHALLPREELHEDGSEVGLGSFCVAKRMSWASSRETTRVEDMAYCLLGVFNVNMPLLYGEGERAFFRLQEEIIRGYDDDSILAWGLNTEIRHRNGLLPEKIAESICGSASMSGLLARSPKDFENCHNLEYSGESTTPFMMTNQGLQIELPLLPVYTPESRYQYHQPDEIHGWVGLLSCSAGTGTKVPGIERTQFGYPSAKQTLLVGVRAATQATLTKITILQHKESQSVRNYSGGYRHTIINTSEALRAVGYRISTASGRNMDRIRWGYGYHPRWDPVQNIFTIHGDHITKDLVRICFKLRPGITCHEFSVFMRAKHAIVREGPSFTEAEQRTFYDFLKDKSQKDDDDDPVVTGANESACQRYRIVVSIEKKVVFRWCMYEVSVDAVRYTKEEDENTSEGNMSASMVPRKRKAACNNLE
jgi:hypothetical protein